MKATIPDKIKKLVGAGAFFLLMLLPFITRKSLTDKSPWCQPDNGTKGELTWD